MDSLSERMFSDNPIETHPLGVFIPTNARLLMLGSFPPKRQRWSMEFFYPNFQNDMWRIVGKVFFDDTDHFVIKERKIFDEKAIKSFCKDKGIALGDTATQVRRLKDNASDKFLEVVEKLDLLAILERIPLCRDVVVTGQKAVDTILTMVDTDEPPVGGNSIFKFGDKEYTLWRMPSSSRAYPKPLMDKVMIYEKMFRRIFDEAI